MIQKNFFEQKQNYFELPYIIIWLANKFFWL
jgi:hypothetical protein